MTELQEVRQLAEDHPDWVEYRGGMVAYQSIIETEYPHIDIPCLAAIYDDHRGDWCGIVKEYEGIEGER